jgi:hypothetical protein
MKAPTERKIIRWIHIIASLPIVGYVDGPVKNFPHAVSVIQGILFPLIVLGRALVVERTLGQKMGTQKK